MSKLHFLFIMLNIAQVNIINQGAITGIISKLEFLKKRKEEDAIMKQNRRRKRIQNSTIGVGMMATFGKIGNAIGFASNAAPTTPRQNRAAAEFNAGPGNAEQKEKLLNNIPSEEPAQK